MKKIIVIGLISLLIATLVLFGCTQSKLTDGAKTTDDEIVKVESKTDAENALVETTTSVENIESAFEKINESLTK